MKKIFCLLFVCYTGFCAAQIDSLKQVLPGTSGKEKLKLLNRLTALDSAPSFRTYHKQAMALAASLNDRSGEVHALCAMGDHFFDRSLPDSAYPYYEKALNEARKYKLPYEIIMCLDKSAMVMEYNSHYDQALALYNEAVTESRKLNDKKEITRAIDHLGLFHLYQRNDSMALKYLDEELRLAQELNDSNVIYICLNNIGLVYANRGEYVNCIQYYKKALLIERKLHANIDVARSLLNLGILHKDLGDYDLALEYLLESALYFEKSKMPKELGSCYNSIGVTYMELKETAKALHYHFKSLDIRTKINNRRGIAGSYNNIGETYKEQGKYNLALLFLNRAVILKKELGDKAFLASSLDLLGEVYFLKQDYVQAENYYLQCMELRQQVEDPKGKAKTLNKMGALYFEWEKTDLALQKLEEARILATAIGAKTVLRNNYEITIKVLKEKGDLKELQHYYDEYIALNDDILNEQKNKALTEMEVKYKTEEKDQQIALMNEKEKSQAAIVSQQYTFIYSLAGGILLLIVIVLVSFSAYRSGIKSNKQSKIIIEQKQMMIVQKQTMMKELHHRVKNNLQLLSSLLQLQHKRLEDPSTKEAIKAVEHRLNAMLLIHQDLYGESADSCVDMKIYVQKMIDNLLFAFSNPKVQVNLDLPADELSIDAGKALNIGFIFNEVINNSFKHAFVHTQFPVLDIMLKTNEQGKLLFTIADNGKGMRIENEPGKPTSFGLGLIHLLVKEMEGNITIASDSKGSRFEFIIPVN